MATSRPRPARPARFERVIVGIATTGGRCSVSGLAYQGLVAHRALGRRRGFVVSHVASGCGVLGALPTLADARRAIRQIADMADWTRPATALPPDLPLRVEQALRFAGIRFGSSGAGGGA